MRFVMLIYETPEDFSARSSPRQDALFGAWRKYHKDLVEAGVYVTGAPLQPDASGTTVRGDASALTAGGETAATSARRPAATISFAPPQSEYP